MSIHGTGLDVASCRNAWEKIDLSSDPHLFVTNLRHSPDDAITVPVRLLSDDGFCAIVRCPFLF